MDQKKAGAGSMPCSNEVYSSNHALTNLHGWSSTSTFRKQIRAKINNSVETIGYDEVTKTTQLGDNFYSKFTKRKQLENIKKFNPFEGFMLPSSIRISSYWKLVWFWAQNQ